MFFLINSMDWVSAILYPEIIIVGWILFLIKSIEFFNNYAAIKTTLVVPSPTYESCLWAN